ncbi:MAG: hypothetical protein IT249_10645 [Chitinophagaceae bacterium]|nr:hypothetical protein [Chitinophagaceae bacterium]
MKKIPLLFLLTISFTFGFSQSFMHGVGVGMPIVDFPKVGINAGFALTYEPRLNFVETEALSVSISIPVSIGFTGSKGRNTFTFISSSDTYILNFMLNAPAIINLNVGAGSTKENNKRFGFFVGGGFGYHYGGYSLENENADSFFQFTTYTKKYGSSFGPAGNLGLRFAVGSHQKNIEARLSYMKAISESKTAVYGVAALFNF